GISDSVALGLVTAAKEAGGAATLPTWAKNLPADVTTLVDGVLLAPDADGANHLYGIAAGTVPCDCTVTASWEDGVTPSGTVRGGIFIVSRQYDDAFLKVVAPSDSESPPSEPPHVLSVTVDE